MSDGYSDDDFEDYSDDGFEDQEPDTVAAAAVPATRPQLHPSYMLNRPGSFNHARQESLPDAIQRENHVVAQRPITPNGIDRPGSHGSGRPGSARPTSASRRNSYKEFQVPDLDEDLGLPQRKSILPSRDQLQSDAQTAAQRSNLQRQRAVMAAIKLEVTGMDNMYDSFPMSKFDLMAMGRGVYAKTAVASVQTNDDNRESETQTETIETGYALCQVPDDQGVSREDLEAGRSGKRKPARSLLDATLEADSERKLAAFVRSVGHLFLKLLGEDSAAAEVSPWASVGSNSSSKYGASLLSLRSAQLQNRPVAAVAYSHEHSSRLLTAMKPAVDRSSGTASQEHGLAVRGMLCVWDLRTPQQPTHQLICEGSPSCCCWSTDAKEPYLVFAGMEEGGVCLWDLREPGMRYPGEAIDGQDISHLRRPTYSTEFLPPDGDIPGGVAAVAAVPRAKSTIADKRRNKANSQLLSCGLWGDVTVWSVNEMSEADVAGTSEVDFGLRVGGRVRLLKNSALLRIGLDAARPAHRLSGIRLQCTRDVCLLPRDSNQFVVAADGGRVLMGARYGEAPAPKEFCPEDWGMQPLTNSARGSAATQATSVHFSPFFPEVFVAGYSNGSVALYSIKSSLPLRVWTELIPNGVHKVRWSPARPGVLFVLDPSATLYAFDLSAANPDSPVATEQLPGGELLSFEVSHGAPNESSDRNAEDGWVSPAAGAGGAQAGGGQHSFALGFVDGHVDVHLFSEQWTTPAQHERMAVSTLLGVT